MTGKLPTTWHCDGTDTYRPTPDARPRRFATYVHDTGDVSLRVAPATLDALERPGYELAVTTFPGLEFGARDVVRTATTYGSCDRLAHEFMSLFDGAYERPADVEAAVAYASEHLQPSSANDYAVVPTTGRATRATK